MNDWQRKAWDATRKANDLTKKTGTNFVREVTSRDHPDAARLHETAKRELDRLAKYPAHSLPHGEKSKEELTKAAQAHLEAMFAHDEAAVHSPSTDVLRRAAGYYRLLDSELAKLKKFFDGYQTGRELDSLPSVVRQAVQGIQRGAFGGRPLANR